MKLTVSRCWEVQRSGQWRACWGKRCLSLPRTHLQEIWAVLPRSAAFQHLQSSDCLWEEHPGIPLHGAVKLSFFISFTAASYLWEIPGGNGIGLGCSSNKGEGKVLRARTLPVLAASTIQSCCCNSAFLPFFWCLLLPGAGFLSHQIVGGLVGANPPCYTTHLVEFFWSVSHSWWGHFYFGCVK